MPTRILVTGGAGFVGAHLAIRIKSSLPNVNVTAFDNLRRRGSEFALPRLRQAGVHFQHGDVRQAEDIAAAGPCDVLIECSAEPSVHAGYDGQAAYVTATNLGGTIHCLEAARRSGAAIIFLSTSRVYPIAALRGLPLTPRGNRLALDSGASGPGWTEAGVAETFPVEGARTLYGATKLASELMIEEYRAMFGVRAVINRCSVIAGPWQMGKVDQGFVALWAARHLYGGRLSYTGFGGEGLQVRDVLHVDDLSALVLRQMEMLVSLDGSTFNVGGGASRSISLRELTALCRERAGRDIPIGADPDTSAADVPYYVSDATRVQAACGWAPSQPFEVLLDDVFDWLRTEEAVLRPLLSNAPGEA